MLQSLGRLPTFPRTTASAASMSTRSTSLKKINNGSLHVSKPTWWLESRFHFSFADYFNPENTSFGVLRVVNDDLVKGHAGFGTHQHRDAEIFSYIVNGQLTHKDSMGNKEALARGGVQYLSAGSGIAHSEMNDDSQTCRFLQVWISPERRAVTPQYGSSTYTHADRHNLLLHILGGTGPTPDWPKASSTRAPISLHQDVNVYVSEDDAGHTHSIALAPGRQAYLVAIEGSLSVNGELLQQRDAAELVNRSDMDPWPLELVSGDAGSHFMLIEMKRS